MTHIFEGKPVRTFGDMGEIVATIAKAGDRARAKAFLESYRAFCKETSGKPENADANIGYWTGYFDADLAAKARAVFAVEHPIFGNVKPTTEEALQAGYAMARGENPRVDPTGKKDGG